MSAAAIATGPWAPVGIERRTSTLAEAFLVPTWLLKVRYRQPKPPRTTRKTIRAVSMTLRVNISSLIDRLYNLNEITFDDRIRLRAIWLPDRTQ